MGLMTRPSLYEFAGGRQAFLRLAAAHYQRCLDDPVLNHPFSHPGQHLQHVERLAAYWAEVLGGPVEFSTRCSDHSAVLHMHSETGAEADLGRRFLDCFVAALDDAGLRSDPAFRAAMRAYMEWAVAEVMSYARPGSIVATELTMPAWGWDGLITS
jgi:hemoglobin